MRGNPEAHMMVAPHTLDEALTLLAEAPGEWTPIAGGTELMVAHAAGRLTAQKLMSVQALGELDGVEAAEGWLRIGGGATFGQLRVNSLIGVEFPLLAKAAAWVGSIANQSRATVAGNIVNGSPAADGPTALLVYDAEIELISRAGRRRMPYAEFHTGYKRSVLRGDELVLALHLPRRFVQHRQYLRKVGARRAMAITKVAIGASCLLSDGRVEEIRLAGASVADRPVRLLQTEEALVGRVVTEETKAAARSALFDEVKPIDDIRSTALYRRAVAVNLLDEFLNELRASV